MPGERCTIATLRDPSTPIYVLTFAAETLGQTKSEAVLDALLALRSHASPLVREGVVYGLAYYADRELVRSVLEAIAKHDESQGVRAAATEALEP